MRSAQTVTHDFRSYGTFALPIGPNKLLLGKSSGWVAGFVEGWQTSFILNLSTGNAASVTSTYLNGAILTAGAATVEPTGLYGNSAPDIVGPFPIKDFGKVQWNGDCGSYFGSHFARVSDPQCGQVAGNLKQYCTLQAVTDANTGQLLLQNPQPGKRGTLGRQTMELPGIWAFDAAMSKSVRISENKSILVRMDATNVLNHPNVGNCPTTTGPQCTPVLNNQRHEPVWIHPNQRGSDSTVQRNSAVQFLTENAGYLPPNSGR